MKVERLDDYLSPEAREFRDRPMPVFPFIEDVYRVGSARKWFVVYTAPRAEDKAAEGLKAKGFENYTPIQSYWRPQSRLQKRKNMPKQKGERPLFPRYVMACLPVKDNEAPFGTIRAINGVQEFVQVEGAPLVISSSLIAALKQREDAGEFDETATRRVGRRNLTVPKWVKVGGTVRMGSGPFAAFNAMIEEILPKERVKVAVSIFGRATRIETELANLQRVW